MRLFAPLFLFFLASSAIAKPLSFAELGVEALSALFEGRAEDVVQFRAGDRLPLSVQVTGDLLNTVGGGEIELEVQQDFQLKRDGDDVLMSFDGQTFLPLADAVRGRIAAEARGGDDGRVRNLSLLFDLWRDVSPRH